MQTESTVTGQSNRFYDLPESVKEFLIQGTIRKDKGSLREKLSKLFERTAQRIRVLCRAGF